MMKAYCDESADGKQRVFVVAGYIGKSKTWDITSRIWRNRCLRDGIRLFHAVDCENAIGDFASLSKHTRISLKTDLTNIVKNAAISGFSVAVYLEDYREALDTIQSARRLLFGPYHMAFQYLIRCISEELNRNSISTRVSYVFEEQEEFSGKARIIFNQVKAKFPELSERMGALRYVAKSKFVPLQMADNLAYETMKWVLNERYDPSRAQRKSVAEMKTSIGMVRVCTKETFAEILAGNTSDVTKDGNCLH